MCKPEGAAGSAGGQAMRVRMVEGCGSVLSALFSLLTPDPHASTEELA